MRDLGRLGGADTGEARASALAALERSLSDDGAAGVRAEAALALADAGAHESIGALVQATRDEHVRVRQMALIALGELAAPEDEHARRAVERALSDGAPQIRFQALVALNRISPTDTADRILRHIDDDDPHIRYIAWRIAEEQWLNPHNDASVQSAPDELMGRARKALRDDAAEVRLAAAIVLGRAGQTDGADVIAEAVNRGAGAREPEDEEAAIELAGALHVDSARPGLERRAFGAFGLSGLVSAGWSRQPFAWQARVALAKWGHPRARTDILRGLGAWTRDGRTLAVAAAGQAQLHEARELIAGMRGDASRADPRAVEEALAALDQN